MSLLARIRGERDGTYGLLSMGKVAVPLILSDDFQPFRQNSKKMSFNEGLTRAKGDGLLDVGGRVRVSRDPHYAAVRGNEVGYERKDLCQG